MGDVVHALPLAVDIAHALPAAQVDWLCEEAFAAIPAMSRHVTGVHHVALRVPAGQTMQAWVARLDSLGYRNSGVVDRHYFVSGYVREPNHILFELATDGPGFDVDGPLDGEKLSLPPFLEPRRAAIEARLKPLATARV